MKDIFIFIISLLIPMLFYRSFFYLTYNHFKKPFLRAKTGLQIHHLHYGIIFILIAIIILLLSDKNIYVIILLGLGLGLMLDLFIPSLLLKSNRQLELKIYQKTFLKTIILFILIISIIVLLSL